MPTGGTSDFGPEMLHAAARGETYKCFVGPDAKIPFMAMPDAIKALVQAVLALPAKRRSVVISGAGERQACRCRPGRGSGG